MHTPMQCSQNAHAFLAIVLRYTHRMFMKLTPVVAEKNDIDTELCTTQRFLSHMKVLHS
jgi:hypothetical protein